MNKLFALIITAVMLSGCATSPPAQPLKVTTSGQPEGVFHNTTVAEVQSKIIMGCSEKGFMPDTPSGNQVVCSQVLQGNQALMATMLMGNSYSTQPEYYARFVLAQVNTDVKVVAYQWIQLQMAFGQVKRTELTAVANDNNIQSFLFNLGAE